MDLDIYKSFLTGHEDIWIAPYDIQQEIIHIDQPVDDRNIKDVMQQHIGRIEELNSNNSPKKFLVSISRVFLESDGFEYLLELCQKYEKVCFQTKHGSYHVLYECAKDKDLLSLLDLQRVFVSIDSKWNLNERNLYHYLTMKKDKDYWREMATQYHTTVKAIHYHLVISRMTDEISKDIGNVCKNKFGKPKMKDILTRGHYTTLIEKFDTIADPDFQKNNLDAYRLYEVVDAVKPKPPVELFQAMVERFTFNDIKHNDNSLDWKNDSIDVMMKKVAGSYVNCYSMLSDGEKDLLNVMKAFLSK